MQWGLEVAEEMKSKSKTSSNGSTNWTNENTKRQVRLNKSCFSNAR